MSTPILVHEFYERIWNRADLAAVSELLTTDFRLRGSLGSEMHGHDAFKEYVRSVRGALADYRCDILACGTGPRRWLLRRCQRRVILVLGHRILQRGRVPMMIPSPNNTAPAVPNCLAPKNADTANSSAVEVVDYGNNASGFIS